IWKCDEALSACRAVKRLVGVHLQRGDEGFLRDLHLSELAHPLLSFLLLVEELALTGDVAAVAFRGDVFAQRTDRLARNHLAADRRLDRNLEEVARNEVLEFLAHRPAARLRALAIDDDGKRIDGIAIDEDRHLDEVALFVTLDVIIEARIAAADRFEPIVEV